MSSAITELTDLATASDRFGYSHDDLYPTQLAALDERFQDRRERIKLLRHRIDETETTAIRTLADAVPLLFPHSVYKSYPERFLAEQQWDRLATWLNSLSSHPIDPVETAGIDGIDDWIERLAAAGHHVSCTSGTTGKSAMLIGSDADIDWAARDTVNVFTWGSGIEPTRDRRMVGLASSAVTPRNSAVGAAQQAAFSDPEKERFGLPILPITVGTLTAMVVLRKKVADGAASPEELATYERTSQQRQAALDKALVVGAEALTGYRDEKLYISGMWNMLYQVAAIVRDMGYSGADFHPGNCIYVAGGRKGAQLPENY
ncbi:MAG: hypothetical protein H5T78_28205, partial [Nocardia sp.]|nr:hypothetical protein [Nocardia sp.]